MWSKVFLVLSSIVLLYLCSAQGQRRLDFEEERQRAMSSVLWLGSESKRTRPAGREPAVINITLSLTHIVDLDTDRLLLHSVGYPHFIWRDERLAFRSPVIRSVRIDAGKIWTPDIELYNAAAPVEMLNRQNLAVVYSNGMVEWLPNVGLRSFCDHADDDGGAEAYRCTFNFGSWVYNGYEIDLQVPRNDSLVEFVPRPGWHITATRAERGLKFYPCCSEPYPSAIFTYKLVRA